MSGNVESFGGQVLHYFRRAHETIRREPIEGPAAWRGETLARDESAWTETLGSAELAELDAALAHAKALGKPLGETSASDFPLPTLEARIRSWARELLDGRGFLRVRGFPVERWGEADASLVYWAIGQHLGRPGAQNPEGELLGHVRDTGEAASDPNVRRYKTAGDIAFHCDAADAVGLLCLRTARRGGASRITSSVSIYNELLARHPAWIERLYEPFLLDSRNEEKDGRLPYFPVPPCRHVSGRLQTFYHSDYFRSVVRHDEVAPFTELEQGLLDAYDAIANEPALRLDMELAIGDLQLLSNHTIVHARTAYDDWDEPERKRHLLRLWLSLDRD